MHAELQQWRRKDRKRNFAITCITLHSEWKIELKFVWKKNNLVRKLMRGACVDTDINDIKEACVATDIKVAGAVSEIKVALLTTKIEGACVTNEMKGV